MSFYAFVIVNPASGAGSVGRRWPELRGRLDRQLERWDHEFTLGPRDAIRLARQAVHAGYEMIVCVGGDGTMSEVVTGLFEEEPQSGPTGQSGSVIAERPIRPGVVLGVVRVGTGGDFGRHLGLPGRGSVEHLGGERTEVADLGWVEYETDSGRARSAFLNIASFGLSGVVDDKVNRSTKVFGGRVSFLVGLARALVTYRPVAVRLSVDGERVHEGLLVLGAVANGSYFGGGMRVARDALIDDGKFDVVLQLRSGVREIASVRDVYTGAMAEWDSVHTLRGRSVEAESLGQDVLLDIDGEQLGRLPARFTVVPGAVRIKTA